MLQFNGLILILFIYDTSDVSRLFHLDTDAWEIKTHAERSTHTNILLLTHTHTPTHPHTLQKQWSGIMDKAMEKWGDFIIHTLLTTSHLLNARILVFVSASV